MVHDGQHSRFATAAMSISIALAAVALLWYQVCWTWPYFSDDAFIALRYADRLLAGRGLTWNDGEWVEGYSNLLWILGCSALGVLRIDLVLAARILGFACTVATFVVLLATCPPRTLRSFPAAAAGPLALAASAPLAVWACGGLEGPMVLLWVVWGTSSLLRLLQEEEPLRSRALLRPGLPFALLCLTRVDGPLWVSAAAIVAVFAWDVRAGYSAAMARVGWLLLLPAVAMLGQFVFRIIYYGEWVPNTAHVKLRLSGPAIALGAEYVVNGMKVLRGALLLALPGIALVFRREWRAMALLVLVPTLLTCGYVVLIGGDHFLGWRHLLAPLGGLVLLGCLGLSVIAQRLYGLAVAVALATLAPILLWHYGRVDPRTVDAGTETWEWEGEALGLTLRDLFKNADARPRLAVDNAGAVPYFSRLRCLDMLGLNDREIAKHPSREGLPSDFFVPGHSIGNGGYVMDEQPDLLLHGSPPGNPLPQFPSGWQLEKDPRFLAGYRCVLLETPEFTLRSGGTRKVRAPLWMRLDGECGLDRSDVALMIPAYLLGSYQEPYALAMQVRRNDDPDFAKVAADLLACKRWWEGTPAVAVVVAHAHGAGDANGEAGHGLVLELRDRTPATLRGIELPAGLWRIALEPHTAQVEVTLRTGEGTTLPHDAGKWSWRGGRIDIAAAVMEGARMPQQVAWVRLLRE